MKKLLLLFSVILFFSASDLQAQCTGTNPIISQVVEGSSQNKAVEILNPSPVPIDLSLYELVRFANGSNTGATISLSGTSAAGDVFVIANPGAETAILDVSDQTNGTISHNGDDSYVLQLAAGGVVVDSYGDIDDGGNSFNDNNSNLIRVTSGGACPYDTNPSDPYDASKFTSTPYTTGPVPDLGDPTLLPVELTYFNGKTTKGNQIALEWRTETELNNHYFAVEKSRDGQKFEEIGQVKGAGTTVEAQTYTFVDDAAKVGVNYYRLAQYDFDGSMEYHKVVAIALSDAATEVSVYPTLADATLNVALDGEATLKIMNITGQVVKEVAAADFTRLDVSDLTSGSYFLIVEWGTTREVINFLKQ